MAARQSKTPNKQTPAAKRAHPAREQTGPAAPEYTNHDHAAAVGSRAVVPGAGIVSAGADAGPKENRRTGRRYPGEAAEGPTRSTPGARRRGTTRSRPAAVPASGGL